MHELVHVSTLLHDIIGAATPSEYALVDIREKREFSAGHPLLAVNAPYSSLERDFPVLVPRRSTRVILFDNGPHGHSMRAARAAERLLALGYDDVSVLDGGIDAWKAAKQPLLQGENVWNKAFSEYVQRAAETPQIEAGELQSLRQHGEASSNVVVFDCQTAEDFSRAHVPGSVHAPLDDLLHLVATHAPDPSVPIVVSCAGRTASLIGAQTLVDAGIANPVFALRDGMVGWQRAGLTLESSATAGSATQPSTSRSARSPRKPESAPFASSRISVDRLDEFLAETGRTTYLFDIRASVDHGSEQIDVVSASGADLINRQPVVTTVRKLVHQTDLVIGTRHARVVLIDVPGSVRAGLATHWLQQLGMETYVLEADRQDETICDTAPNLVSDTRSNSAATPAGSPAKKALSPRASERLEPVVLPDTIDLIGVTEAAALLASGVPGMYFGPSTAYRTCHPAKTNWVNRSSLTRFLEVKAAPTALILIGEEEALARLAAVDLRDYLPVTPIALVEGGMAAWLDAGLPVETGAHHPNTLHSIDEPLLPAKWADGTIESASCHLDWISELPDLIGPARQAGFRLESRVDAGRADEVEARLETTAC